MPYELLDVDGVKKVEPALQYAKANFVGGLRLPNDQTGDCNLFTKRLADECKKMGVRFLFGRTIEHIMHEGGKAVGVVVDGETLQADNYVLALGSYSRQMLLPLGLKLPVYPLKGYSLTLDIDDEKYAPISTVLDETYKVALTRFDKRIRVGGMAELCGFDLSLNPKRRETLTMVTKDLFDAGNTDTAKFWTGLRPMTPDGTPIIGATKYERLFINTGHGTLGWTMACGSGKLLSDIILEKPTDIRLDGLSLERYH